MNRTILMLVAVAALASAGCSKKELIAQKDAQILDLQEDVSALQAEVAEQKRMNDDLDRQLASFQEEKQVWLVEKGNLTQITLDGAAAFPTASAELTDEGKEAIDRIWSVVQQYPDRRILIEGHADNRPIKPNYRWKYTSNWELSSARAHAVLHYIVNTHSGDTSRLAAVGYGENEPVADNSTPEGLAQNRRVVLTIGTPKAMRDLISYQPAEMPSMENAGVR